MDVTPFLAQRGAMRPDRAAYAEKPAGGHRVDDRRVISDIIHLLKTGGRWCDCPSEYGPSTTIYNGFIASPGGVSGQASWRRWQPRAR